jgi:2-dehydropantoate 2-reductase
MLGSPGGEVDLERISVVACAFSEAGIPTEPTVEITKYIWGKVLYNCCLNALSALLGCTYDELSERAETREIMRVVIEEIFAVASKKGIELMWSSPQEYEGLLLGRLIPDTYSHHSSMLQDVRRGKRTEIDSLNGAIARMAGEVGLAAPVNWTLTRLVKSKEPKN